MRNTKGLSLVEILIGITILGTVGGILLLIVVNGSGLISSQNTQISQSLSLNSASTDIHDSIEYASSIITTYTSGSNTFNTSLSTLIFQLPSITVSGQVIDGKFDTVVITADPQKNTILKKYTYPDLSSSRTNETKVLLSNLSNLKFYYLDDNGSQVTPSTAHSIDYIINVSEKNNYGTKVSSISGRVNLKNL